ncbi:MAG: aspartate--ammonia ligase [Malacoplasma sp.]|nr:aspartate--ammonia ligase [Malacoplasma sp.]
MHELTLLETQKAIKFVKDLFQINLAHALKLHRVSAPIVLERGKGINDDLNGVEAPVTFMSNTNGLIGEVPQSLAKWKRMALFKYDIPLHEGIYADMNAIRKDEILSDIHSIYVDQWDWELHIKKSERNLETLKVVVKKIYEIIRFCQNEVNKKYEWYSIPLLPEEITFITSQELLDLYPDLSPKEREDAICKEKQAVFIIGVGAKLSNGEPHDLRAPDYDDWSLNGDIVVYNHTTESALELSSMGIRVDEDSLVTQLEITNKKNRLDLEFHKKIVNKELPYSIGGGIGQSRLCYFMLHKHHIGEVQTSIWPEDVLEKAAKKGLKLL